MPDPRSTPPTDPDDAVRRLLASARHDEPVPAEVAERLDRVLSGLTTGSETTGRTGPKDQAAVVSLEARRRRRRAAGRLLVAAAVVVVAGVGVAHWGTRGDEAPNASSAVQREGGGSSADDRSAPAPSEGLAGGLDYAGIVSQLPVSLRTDHLRRDLRRAVILAAQLQPRLQDDGPVAAALAEGLPGWACGTGTSTRAYGGGVLLPATYEGRPAVLALRSSPGDGLPVEVLACGSGDVLRRTVVDAT